MPASIDIKGDSLIVDMEGADKLWALKPELTQFSVQVGWRG